MDWLIQPCLMIWMFCIRHTPPYWFQSVCVPSSQSFSIQLNTLLLREVAILPNTLPSIRCKTVSSNGNAIVFWALFVLIVGLLSYYDCMVDDYGVYFYEINYCNSVSPAYFSYSILHHHFDLCLLVVCWSKHHVCFQNVWRPNNTMPILPDDVHLWCDAFFLWPIYSRRLNHQCCGCCVP